MIKVADEVWTATALLHRESPQVEDFTVEQIIDRVRKECLTENLRPGVRAHLAAHAVASKEPNPGRYRLLTETARGRRRLFRPGDSFHPERASGKTVPAREDLPEKYHTLLDWYNDEYLNGSKNSAESGPSAAGSATELLRKFAGCLSREEGEEMMRAIEDFEHIEAQ